MDFFNHLDILNLQIDEHKNMISNLVNRCSKLYKFRNTHKEELVQDNKESKDGSSIDLQKEELEQCKLVDTLLEKAAKTRKLFQKRLLTSNNGKEYRINDKLKLENSFNFESSNQFENRLDSNTLNTNQQSEYLKKTSRQIKKSYSKTSFLKKKRTEKVTSMTNQKSILSKKICHIDNNEKIKPVMAEYNHHKNKVSNFNSDNANKEKVYNDKNNKKFSKSSINNENLIKTNDSTHNLPALPVNRSSHPSYKPAYLKAPYLTKCQATKKPRSKLKHYSEVNKIINNCSSNNIIKNNKIQNNLNDKVNTNTTIQNKASLHSNITNNQNKPIISNVDANINNINTAVSNKSTNTSKNNSQSITSGFLNNNVDNIHTSNTRTQVNEENKAINEMSTTDDNYNKSNTSSNTNHKDDGYVCDSISLSEIGPYLRMPRAYNKLKMERFKIINKIKEINHEKTNLNGVTCHQDRFLNLLEQNNKENLTKKWRKKIENGKLLKCINDIVIKFEMKGNTYGFEFNHNLESSANISEFETTATSTHTCFLHYANCHQIDHYFRLNIQLSLFKIDLWRTSFLNDLLKDFRIYDIADESSDVRTISKLYRTLKIMYSGRRSAVCVVEKVNKKSGDYNGNSGDNDSCGGGQDGWDNDMVCNDDKAGQDDENDKDLEKCNDNFDEDEKEEDT